MAKMTLDRGPAANFTVVVAEAVVPNMSITIEDRVGPIRVQAVLTVDNAGAGANTINGRIARNGVAIALADRTMVMTNVTRQCMVLDFIELAPTVGDVFTIRASVAAVVVPTLLVAGQCSLMVEGVSQDAAVVAGIGPATP